MAEGIDCNAGRKVEKFAAFSVVELGALASDKDNVVGAGICLQNVSLLVGNDLFRCGGCELRGFGADLDLGRGESWGCEGIRAWGGAYCVV